MRVKDEIKQEALFAATIKVVNEIGFASSSVAKIAKEAGISPATIYIYHENKEDLLVSTYVEIKRKLGSALLRGLDESLPIRDYFEKVWRNGFKHVAAHRGEFSFADQFSNSPFADLVDKPKVERYFEPILNTLHRGVQQKIIKDVPFDLLAVFIFHPMMTLSNTRQCGSFKLNEENISRAFTMAWDAIRL